MKTLQLIFFIFLTLSACRSYDSKDFEFNDKELRHFSALHQGDTIFYESNKHDIDTIVIVGFTIEQHKDGIGLMAPKPANYKAVNIQYIPIDKWHSTMQIGNNPKKFIEYQELFSIHKDPIEKRTTYHIEFKDFYSLYDTTIGEYHADTIQLNNKKISDYYLVKCNCPSRNISINNIDLVYWTDKDGLVAYQNSSGEIWTKSHRPRK